LINNFIRFGIANDSPCSKSFRLKVYQSACERKAAPFFLFFLGLFKETGLDNAQGDRLERIIE
jgi:hypothetical protein